MEFLPEVLRVVFSGVIGLLGLKFSIVSECFQGQARAGALRLFNCSMLKRIRSLGSLRLFFGQNRSAVAIWLA